MTIARIIIGIILILGALGVAVAGVVVLTRDSDARTAVDIIATLIGATMTGLILVYAGSMVIRGEW